MTFEFYIDVEDSSGTRLGGGPLTTAQSWTFTQRMDRAGDFSCVIDANDDMASYCTRKRILRARAWVAGAWVTVGAGIIDNVARSVQANGATVLTISGPDLTGELTYRSVGALELESSGGSVTHSAALTSIAAFAPSGWTITPDGSPPNDAIYGRFNGDTVLAALTKVAEKTQTHFYRSADRAITFASAFSDSGVRAIRAEIDDLAAETAAIVALSATYESHDLLTRIYPRGSGNGDVQLTLQNTTRSAPVGYTLSAANNYIEHDAATASYGRIEAWLDYRDVGPVSNSDADLQAAADMLFDVAVEELARRVEQSEAAYYDVTLAGCSTLVRPLQTVRVAYRDDEAGLDVDESLNVLEATWRVDATGVQTTSLLVASVDRWPQSDVDAIVGNMTQGQAYQALPQLNANSYVTAYTKNVDRDNNATFRFRFGSEVVQVQQVLFEFQLLDFEATVRSVAGRTTTSSSGGGSTVTSSSGGGTTVSSSSGGGTTATSTSGGGTTATSTSGGGTTVSSGGGGGTTVSSTSGGGTTVSSGNGGGTTVTSAGGSGHSHDVTVPDHSHSIPDHQHDITIIGNGAGALTYDIGFGASGTAGGIRHNISASDYTFPTDAGSGGTTSASGGGTTETSTSESTHTHNVTLTDHTHSVTIANHSHNVTLTDHTHSVTIANHTHDVTIANHSHDVTIANHTHNVTIANHTHDVTVANHTHDVTANIAMEYGVYREASARTYALDELEYRVNGGSWTSMGGATDQGDGWYALDVTSAVVSPTIVGRPVQASNTIEVRGITSKDGKSISAWYWDTIDDRIHFAFSPDDTGVEVGDVYAIEGAELGLSPTNLDIDGVVQITDLAVLTGLGSPYEYMIEGVYIGTAPDGPSELVISSPPAGTVTFAKTVTIDAQLSVRNVIQAIAYS